MKKDVREKAIPEEGASAQDESNSKTENEGKQDKRYILFIGKTCVILPDVYVLSRHGEAGGGGVVLTPPHLWIIQFRVFPMTLYGSV